MTKLARLLLGHLARESLRVGIRIPGPDREKRRLRRKINAARFAESARTLSQDVVGGLKSFPGLRRNGWTQHKRNVSGAEKLAKLR